MDLPDRSRRPSSSYSSRRKASKNCSKNRHPQLKESNMSASEHGQAISAKVQSLLESIHGRDLLLPDVVDDEGWHLIALSESGASASAASTSTSSASEPLRPVSELTTRNVQLWNMMNDDTSVSDRLIRRANAATAKHASLKMHKHTATRVSTDSFEWFAEPWVPARPSGPYDSDIVEIGAWAVLKPERRGYGGNLYA